MTRLRMLLPIGSSPLAFSTLSVDFDNVGQPPPGCNAVERVHDIFSFQALAYLDGQTLSLV